jgi:dTDP-4-dehydrorhamnose reductase
VSHDAALRPAGSSRVVVFGGSGQLGAAVREALAGTHEALAPSSADVNLLDSEAVASFIAESAPDVVVNAAAFTRVDDAERERDAASAVNELAPASMARAANRIGARMIHVSTDYVFDGEGRAPYLPTDATSPLNVYGATKRAGEAAVLRESPRAAVVRTAWLHSGRGVNFVATAVRVLSSGKSMRVVDDQIGTPTRAAHLADAIVQLITCPDVTGLLHFTDAGVASWYDVASCVLETLRTAGAVSPETTVTPVGSDEYPRPAQRPRVTVLDKRSSWSQLGWIPPHWRVGVAASTLENLHA